METAADRRDAILQKIILFLLAVAGLCLTSCEQNSPMTARQQVLTQSTLEEVRLADGMPLRIHLSTRWEIENRDLFKEKFRSTGRYDSLVLTPKQLELASQVSNRFESVDSVFTVQRQVFIQSLKKHLHRHLGERGLVIKEVIVSKIEFPESYTSVKEKLALQEQELKSIKKQSIIDLENAEAQKMKAIAQGEVNVEQAQLDARLEKIQAQMEESRRASRLAKAETDKQVAEKRAKADARRQVLMAEADARQRMLYAEVEVEKSRQLKNVEVERQEELSAVELNKKRLNEEISFQQDVKMAQLFSDEPSYAAYLVNKQMAEKVQIAVVPGSKNDLFDGLFTNSMNFKK